MISSIILVVALSGCPNGQCGVQRVVTRERSVTVQKVVEAAPVRTIVKKVYRHRFFLRRHR